MGPPVAEVDFASAGGKPTSVPKGGRCRGSTRSTRIVPDDASFSYDMHLDDRRISVSLTTIEFSRRQRNATRLPEQGAYLDGWDNPADARRHRWVPTHWSGAERQKSRLTLNATIDVVVGAAAVRPPCPAKVARRLMIVSQESRAGAMTDAATMIVPPSSRRRSGRVVPRRSPRLPCPCGARLGLGVARGLDLVRWSTDHPTIGRFTAGAAADLMCIRRPDHPRGPGDIAATTS